jgi:AcrR family transcriptional regulator
MGAKTPNTKDRRVQRTDHRLHAAFISLVHERGYDGVTIGDVVQRAGVGRSTFYTHFADLEEMHGHWLLDFAAKERKRGNQPVFGFARAFLEHANGQRRAWRGLAGKKAGAVLRKRLRRNLLTLVREEVDRLGPKQRPAVVEGIVHYIAGAFAELLFWWIDSPTALSPAEVDRLFQRLTASALALLQDNNRA